MRHLLQRIRAYWPRFLDGWNLAWGIPVPEDEEWCTYPEETRTEGKAIHLGDIYFAADYERDLKHEDGREEDENWIQRIRDDEDRFLGR